MRGRDTGRGDRDGVKADKHGSAPLLESCFVAQADVCAFPTGGSDVFGVKCSAKQGDNPSGMQVPKQLAGEPAAKAEALKAWLFSDTG